MSIAEVVQEYFRLREWEDEVEVDEENNSASASFSYGIDDQSFKTFIEINEATSLLHLFMYAPNKCPEDKQAELLRLLNHVNTTKFCSCVVILPDGVIRQQYTLDVEDGSLSPKMVHNVLTYSVGIFEEHYAGIMSVIFAGKTAAEVIEEGQ